MENRVRQYKRAAGGAGESGKVNPSFNAINIPTEERAGPSTVPSVPLRNRSDLVAIEADDDAGEGFNIGIDEDDDIGVGDKEVGEENYQEDDEPNQPTWDFPVGFDDFEGEEELAEIESDGELEVNQPVPFLDSADM